MYLLKKGSADQRTRSYQLFTVVAPVPWFLIVNDIDISLPATITYYIDITKVASLLSNTTTAINDTLIQHTSVTSPLTNPENKKQKNAFS